MFGNGDLLQGELMVALLACLACIAIHAVIMAALTWTVHRTVATTQSMHPQLRLVLIMMTSVTVLMVAHVLEVGVWGVTYIAVEIVPERSDAYYFAFVNYTTLGYGDLLPARRWRLLGPAAAMNGVLLFGWSTAVIYDVLRTVVQVIPLKASQA